MKYVITARQEGCNIACFSEDKPSAFYFGDTQISPWIDFDSVMKYGGVIVWEISNQDAQEKLPAWVDNLGAVQGKIIFQDPLEFDRLVKPWIRALMNMPVRKVKIGFAILPPMDVKNEI